MKYLYLDAFSGISGNMFIGAMLDLGLNPDDLKKELKKIKLDGYELKAERKVQSAIYGTFFDVDLTNDMGTKDHGFDEHQLEHEEEKHGNNHHHYNVRHLSEIVELIKNSDLNDNVKTHAINIFNDIGRAESKAHNLPMSEIHFHEIGATDSLIDIIGSCIAIDLLGIDEVISSPISDGHGFINVAHGQMPVPVPAVANMLAGGNVPIHQREDIHTELLTPTGLGVAKEFVKEFRPIDTQDNIKKVGYGFGSRETGAFNALRVFLCERDLSCQDIKKKKDEIVALEANIDDQTGQGLGFAIEQIMNAGALDAYFSPIYMKKERPAVKITVLAPVNQLNKFEKLLFKYTTTKGVRHTILKRAVMTRNFKKVTVLGDQVRIKIASYDDISKLTPEYDDCKRIAINNNLSLEQVMEIAQQKVNKNYEQQK